MPVFNPQSIQFVGDVLAPDIEQSVHKQTLAKGPIGLDLCEYGVLQCTHGLCCMHRPFLHPRLVTTAMKHQK